MRSFGKCVRVAQQQADRRKIHRSGTPTDLPSSNVPQQPPTPIAGKRDELGIQLVAADASHGHCRIVAWSHEQYNPLVAMQHGHICRTSMRNGNAFCGKVSVPPAKD